MDVPLARARHPRREGEAVDTVYELNYLGATGTLLFLSGVLTTVVLRISPRRAVGIYGETTRQFGWAIVTILCVFALAYVMNLSGQTLTLGRWLAGAGSFFAFLAPVVGWFGVAITGTDAGANALFGNLHVQAAKDGGLDAVLLLRGQQLRRRDGQDDLGAEPRDRDGGGRAGRGRGRIFRRIFAWSVGLLLVLCVLVTCSPPGARWMVP